MKDYINIGAVLEALSKLVLYLVTSQAKKLGFFITEFIGIRENKDPRTVVREAG